MKKRLILMAAICLSLFGLTGCSEEFSATMARAGLNTVMSIAIVFAALIFISLIIAMFGVIPKLLSGQKTEKPAAKPAPAPKAAPAPAPVVESVDVTDDLQLVAVITAAIMASLGEEAPADGLVVRSIKKRNVKNWKNA